MRIGTDDAIGVKPGVVDAHRDQAAQPAFCGEVGEIALADTARHTRDELVAAAVLDTFDRLAENAKTSAPFIAHDLRAFDADEWRDVADAAQVASNLVGDHLAIGKHLEVAIGVRGEDVHQLRMKKGLSSEDAEIAVAAGLRLVQQLIHIRE
jgi:hypothetical protein